MVIRNTEGTGAADGDSAIHMRLYLGEWCCAGRVRLTPAPQALTAYPGKEPWLMLPRLRPLSHHRNAVHSVTEQAYG